MKGGKGFCLFYTMNKKILTFVSCLSLILSLTGCGKSVTTQSIIGDVKNNMDNCTYVNYDINYISDTNQKYEDVSFNTKIQYNLNVETNKTVSHITGTIDTSIKDEKQNYVIDTWLSNENENNLIYYKKDDVWYRKDANNSSDLSMNLLKEIYSQNPEVQKDTSEQINGKDCYVINSSLSGEILSDYITTLFDNISLSDDSNINVSLYIYKETSFPAYIKIDLKDIANKLLSETEVNYSFNNCYLEITFNSFNDTEIVLPDNIKSDAGKESGTNNNSEKNQEESSLPSTNEETTSTEDIQNTQIEENYSSEENIPSETETESKLSADWTAFLFQYNNNIFRLPMTYQTIETTGYSVVENEKSVILESGQSYNTTLYNGENTIGVKIENTTTSPKTLKDCDIVFLDFGIYDLSTEEISKFIFNGNINFTNSQEDIINKYGEPTESHDGVALKIETYKDGDNYIEIYFDPDSLNMIELRLSSK